MKKNMRTLILTAAVLVVVAVGVLVVLMLPENADPEPSPLEVRIVECESSDITRIAVQPKGHAYYEISISKNLDGETQVNVVPSTEGFQYSSSSTGFFLSVISQLKSMAVVTDSATEDQLERWGFQDPTSTVKVTLADGTEFTLLVGNATATADGYYLKRGDDGTVYVVTTSYGEKLASKEWDLRDMAYFSYDTEELELADAVQDASLYRDGELVFTVHSRTLEEFQQVGSGAATYEMRLADGQVYETNSSLAESVFLEPLVKAMTFTGILGDGLKDLEGTYGITDTSPKIQLTDPQGNHYEIIFGKKDEQDNTYAYRPDTKTMYYVSSSTDLSFLEVERRDILSSIVWFNQVTKVESLEVRSGGETHKLTYTQGEDEDGNPTVTAASFDGKDVSATDGKRFFSRVISLFAAGEIPEGSTLGAAEYTFTMTYLDGTTSTLELRPMNARQYAMVVDGKSSFYTNIKDVEFMAEGLEYLKKGEEVPLE